MLPIKIFGWLMLSLACVMLAGTAAAVAFWCVIMLASGGHR